MDGTHRLEIEGGGALNGLALCAGYGGLELGIERVFDEYRTVCYVEGEAFAAQHLRKKMEEGRLDEAPIWSNVKSFNGEPWRGKVDIISGGFPCQPYSSAGNRMGESDPRDLWLDFVRIIGEVRPGFLFLENVSNIINLRLREIILDLDLLGYDASWGIVAASDVGAPHQRKRWFCLAVIRNADSNGLDEHEPPENGPTVNSNGQLEGHRLENQCGIDSNPQRFRSNENQQHTPGRELDLEGLCGVDPNALNPSKCTNERSIHKQDRDNIGRLGEEIPNTNGERSPESWKSFKGPNGELIDGHGEAREIDRELSNTNSQRTKGVRGINGKPQEERDGKRNINPEDFHGRGFEDCWQVEPGMGRLVDGASDWVDKLRILGNGVVPQQAAYALQILGARLACGIVEKRTPKD